MKRTSCFDTRFFIEYFYQKDPERLTRLRALLEGIRKRYISAIVIHEIFKITLEQEGRETAKIRRSFLEKDFELVVVDGRIAETSAELRHKYRIPLGDSLIAATSVIKKARVITDDPHFKQIQEVQTKWIVEQ
ncbi:MAG: PIN domain-containing protein [Candidatus Heimdallarchaeota archaeon]